MFTIRSVKPHHFHAISALTLFVLAALSFILSSISSMVSLAATPSAPEGKIWKQVWADEFSTSSVDKQSWSECDGQADTVFTSFTHSVGCTHNCPTNPPLTAGQCSEQMWYQIGNTSQFGGNLKLQSHLESTPLCTWLNNPANNLGTCPGKRTFNYSSGHIQSGYVSELGSGTPIKKSFGPGYFEARIKIPNGNGSWPSFWLHSDDYSTPGPFFEIGIMQALGYSPSKYAATVHSSSTTAQQWCNSAQNLSNDFHTYGVNWQIDQIVFYLDSQVCFSVTDPAILSTSSGRKLYLELNNAVGGWACDTNGGTISIPSPCPNPSSYPSEMLVDYVRVYQLVNKGAPLISNFTYSPEFPIIGQKVMLAWSGEGDSCSIDHGVGSVTTSGSKTVVPKSNTIYTMVCGRDGQTASKSVEVEMFTKDAPKKHSLKTESASPPIDGSLSGGVSGSAPFEVTPRPLVGASDSASKSRQLLGFSYNTWRNVGITLGAGALFFGGFFIKRLSQYKRYLGIGHFIPL